jgi:hypothetical protein
LTASLTPRLRLNGKLAAETQATPISYFQVAMRIGATRSGGRLPDRN